MFFLSNIDRLMIYLIIFSVDITDTCVATPTNNCVIPGAECTTELKCLCKAGYTASGDKKSCEQSMPTIITTHRIIFYYNMLYFIEKVENACEDGVKCTVAGSACESNTCKCAATTTPNADNTKCLQSSLP